MPPGVVTLSISCWGIVPLRSSSAKAPRIVCITTSRDSASENPSSTPPRIEASIYLSAKAIPHEASDVPAVIISSVTTNVLPNWSNIATTAFSCSPVAPLCAMKVTLRPSEIAVFGMMR